MGRNYRYHLLLLSLFLSQAICDDIQPYDPQGGSQYYTTHSTPFPLSGDAHQYSSWPDTEVKEFHFHVYFFQTNDASVADALRLKDELVTGVTNRDFVVVCNGVDDTMLPGLNMSAIPPVNMEPKGPHPIGSYEVWVPKEHLSSAMSHMMLNRGELSILFHPLSVHCVEDHTGRTMWLGPSFNIDRTVLSFDDPDCDSLQYPELGLGYSSS
jgi:DOPA 4,5-dioxygenase